MNSIEREYVHDAYQEIYRHFDNSRAYLWKSVREFLDDLEPCSLIVEIGSGNGKNMLRRPDCINYAFDLCSKFTDITSGKGIDSVIANNLHIPLRDDVADSVLSIAVIHHLSDETRRTACVRELIRILKPGGKLLIQVWALEQSERSKQKFTKSDNLVNYSSSDKKTQRLRYYHVFKRGELDTILLKFSNIRILESYWEMGNWIILAQKL